MSGLPRGWVETTVGAIAECQLGKMLNKAKNQGEPTPYLSNISVRWGSFEVGDLQQMRVKTDERERFTVRPGDLLICEGGEPGRAAVWRDADFRPAYQKALHRVRPLGGIDPDFLQQYFASAVPSGSLDEFFTGTTIKHLPGIALARVPVPLPPLAEQRRIVAKVDGLAARSAGARADLDRIPVLVERFKQAVLERAFAEAASEHGECPLADATSVIFDGPFGSNLKSADYTEAGKRVVRLENIAWTSFRGDKQTFVSEEKFASLARHTLRAGDVMVASFVEDRVRACRLPEDMHEQAINKADCFCFRARTEACDPAFAMYMIASPVTFERVVGSIHGATRPRMSLKDFKALQIPLPPLPEQQTIVARIEAAFARIDRLAAEAAQARGLVDRLDAGVLDKAFRGALVPQDPADEPASVLLERIRAERAAAPKARRGRGRPT